MANLTTSSDIDTFMGSTDNAAARTNLGVLPLAGGTLTGQLIQSTNGAASTPSLLLNGTIFTGGTGTTNLPNFLIQPTGATAATTWNTSGTAIGVNLDVAAGYFMHLMVDGSSRLTIDTSGTIILPAGGFSSLSGFVRAGNIYANSTVNILELYNDSGAIVIGAGVSTADLRRGGAYCLQLGTDAAGVSNQHFKACNRITSNGVGANLTISGGNGRGGAGGSLILATYDTGASATPGTLLTRLTLDTAGMLTFANGVNMSFASTMIGAANTDALAFWGTSPVTQPAHIADPTGNSGTGLDTVDKTVLDATLTDIQASIASINAMLAITGLTAAI